MSQLFSCVGREEVPVSGGKNCVLVNEFSVSCFNIVCFSFIEIREGMRAVKRGMRGEWWSAHSSAAIGKRHFKLRITMQHQRMNYECMTDVCCALDRC